MSGSGFRAHETATLRSAPTSALTSPGVAGSAANRNSRGVTVAGPGETQMAWQWSAVALTTYGPL